MSDATKAAVVLQPVRQGRLTGLLVIKRGTSPGLNEWALPGGHVERGETWQMAASRELYEETGVRHPHRHMTLFAQHATHSGKVVFAQAPEILGLPPFTHTLEVRGRKVVVQPVWSSFPAQVQIMQRFFGKHTMIEADQRSWADDMIAEIRVRMRTPTRINKVVLQTLKSKWDKDDLIAIIDAITRARLPLSQGPLLQLYEFVKSKDPWIASAATLALLASGGKELAMFAVEYPKDVPHIDIVFSILAAFRAHKKYRQKSRGGRQKRR